MVSQHLRSVGFQPHILVEGIFIRWPAKEVNQQLHWIHATSLPNYRVPVTPTLLRTERVLFEYCIEHILRIYLGTVLMPALTTACGRETAFRIISPHIPIIISLPPVHQVWECPINIAVAPCPLLFLVLDKCLEAVNETDVLPVLVPEHRWV